MKIYHVKTQEDYDALMVELDKKGHKWIGGQKPADLNVWFNLRERTTVCLDGVIGYASLEFYKKAYPNTPVIEYKAKDKFIFDNSFNMTNDSVDSPNHYTQNGRETIENIRDTMSSEGYQGYCVGNVVKYLARYKFKNGLEDVRKAKKYIEFLEEELMKQEA